MLTESPRPQSTAARAQAPTRSRTLARWLAPVCALMALGATPALFTAHADNPPHGEEKSDNGHEAVASHAPAPAARPAPKPAKPAARPQMEASPVALMGAAGAPHPTAHAVHWGYEGEGAPENWARLDPANAACSSGVQQSPIDLSGAIPASVATPELGWSATQGGIVLNNGHTIQVNLETAGGLTLEGSRFRLAQFHFHHPSEHTVNGESFPLEVHFVHTADDGRLAVVGVLFREGAANPMLDYIWASAPVREGKAAVAFRIDPAAMLPGYADAFRYAGSLTTPPCSETVAWTVMSEPVTASRAQIQAFARLFSNNARPVQPLARRFVLKASAN